MGQLSRDLMWKCDKLKQLSRNANVKNNFWTILLSLIEPYNIAERSEELNNRTPFHLKIFITFADNILQNH